MQGLILVRSLRARTVRKSIAVLDLPSLGGGRARSAPMRVSVPSRRAATIVSHKSV